MTTFALKDIELTPIMLFNTLTRKKEELVYRNQIRFYSCGQTVYEDLHIGNAKTFLVWDLLVRTLRAHGMDVIHVQNFTDVGHLTDDADSGEDKIAKRARMLDMIPMALVDEKINSYYGDMDAINVLRPTIAPRATGHISEMQDFVLSLMEKGHAYESNGSVYFDSTSFPDYGKMARLNLEGQMEGARIATNPDKRSPNDFALWIKAPQSHIMKYASPVLSTGYPGWHLECSVMAIKYLGETLDIHAGGVDHIPVHHTNEIAQSESYTGKPFARYWMHSAFITINGEKMSKSRNNFITLRSLISQLGATAARYALINLHYRTQGDYSPHKGEEAVSRVARITRELHTALQRLAKEGVEYHAPAIDLGWDSTMPQNPVVHSSLAEFLGCMADDLNVPAALAVLGAQVDHLATTELSETPHLLSTIMLELEILGISIPLITPDEIQRVDTLLEVRDQLRRDKEYGKADAMRDFLSSLGYVVEDGRERKWYKRPT